MEITARYSIPYPTGTDKAGDYPSTAAAAAAAIEAALNGLIIADTKTGPAVAANAVTEVTIPISPAQPIAGYIPSVTLEGARGSVDRLTATVFGRTDTQFKVAVKNMTAKAVAEDTYSVAWALIRRRP